MTEKCSVSFFFFHQATKNDRIYVNAPGMLKEENGEILLLSFNTSKPENQLQAGEENKGLDTEEDKQEESEEVLTPGDLMAFAWQITQGMVSSDNIYLVLNSEKKSLEKGLVLP